MSFCSMQQHINAISYLRNGVFASFTIHLFSCWFLFQYVAFSVAVWVKKIDDKL